MGERVQYHGCEEGSIPSSVRKTCPFIITPVCVCVCYMCACACVTRTTESLDINPKERPS